jgi:hypothetical protein
VNRDTPNITVPHFNFAGVKASPFRSSPRFVMFNDGGDRLQVPVHGIAGSTPLKLLPRITHLYKPSPKPGL